MSTNYPNYPQSGGTPRPGNYPQSGDYGAFPTTAEQGLVNSRPGAWKRLLGLLIDSILVYIVSSLITMPLVGEDLTKYMDEVSKAIENPQASTPELPLGVILTSALSFLIVWFIYRVGMEASKGATLGKMAIGARVRNQDGTPISAGASAVRNLWVVINQVLNLVPGVGVLLSLAILIGLGVTIGKSPEKQSFMDKAAKAIVVDKDSVRA